LGALQCKYLLPFTGFLGDYIVNEVLERGFIGIDNFSKYGNVGACRSSKIQTHTRREPSASASAMA